MTKTKLLVINHARGIGGASIHLRNILEQLDSNIYTMTIFFIFNSDAVQLFDKNRYEIVIAKSIFYKKFYSYFSHSAADKNYRFPGFKKILSYFINLFIYAPQILTEYRPDVVILNSSVLSDWSIACKKMSIKNICVIQEPLAQGLWGIRKNILRYIFKYNCDHLMVISSDNAKRINLPIQTSIVYNFVMDEQFIHHLATKTNSSLHILLFLGGFSEIKGFSTLVNALPYLNENILVNFAGYFPVSMSKKRKMLRLIGIGKQKWSSLQILLTSRNAKIVGAVNEVSDLIESSYAIVFPSTVPHFARPVIEAFALGKPVIASNVEGMDEIVLDGVDGILIPPGDSLCLSKAINWLSENPYHASIMGKNGYKKARRKYSSKINRITINRVLQDLIGDHNETKL